MFCRHRYRHVYSSPLSRYSFPWFCSCFSWDQAAEPLATYAVVPSNYLYSRSHVIFLLKNEVQRRLWKIVGKKSIPLKQKHRLWCSNLEKNWFVIIVSRSWSSEQIGPGLKRKPGQRAPGCLTKAGIFEDTGYNDYSKHFHKAVSSPRSGNMAHLWLYP